MLRKSTVKTDERHFDLIDPIVEGDDSKIAVDVANNQDSNVAESFDNSIRNSMKATPTGKDAVISN